MNLGVFFCFNTACLWKMQEIFELLFEHYGPIFLVQIFGYFFCGITMVRLVRNSGENLKFSDSEFLEVEREKSYLY